MNLKVHTGKSMRTILPERRFSRHQLYQCIVVMKLTILLIALSLQVSATAFSQQVSLNYKNAPLQQVMQSILKQTGYGFIIDAINLKLAKPVTITLKGATIEETLQTIFSSQPFSYRIEGKSIIIQVKVEEKKRDTEKVIPQQKDLMGFVLDQNGRPLEGATLIIKASGKVAITNSHGEFIFKNSPENGILLVRMIGHETIEVSYKNGLIENIILKEINTELDVTVIKGYYNTTKELNTGSVGTLKAVDIAKQPVSDPLMALEGRIPGLYVSQTSGIPGASLNVTLRGLNSIANGNSPLYIIDGIPINSTSLSQVPNSAGTFAISPFTSIRPSDIESIDVLKDADATAIYGSRGANGVILITTKRGKAGKTKLDLNVYNGTGKVTRKLNLMNTQQYLEMRNEGLKNDDASPQDYDVDINGTWDQKRYTDWQKVMIGGTAHVTDAKAAVSGGTEQTQFLLGIGYRKETTVYPGDYSNQISSANVNVNHESDNKKAHINFSSIYTNNNNKLSQLDFTRYMFMAPNAPSIYDAKGQLNWENNTFSNPFALLLRTAKANSENMVSNLTAAYDIIEGLQLKGNFGYNFSRINENALTPFSSYNPNITNDPPSRRMSTIGTASIKSWIIEPQLNYTKSFRNHHLEALIASTFQQSIQDNWQQTASGFSSDALLENQGAALALSTSQGYTQYRYNAIFARIGYNYREKYILNLTGRRDGSSRFGPGKQFGNFGSLGAGWIFSKENWVRENLPFISLGKLRASIGKTGNDQLGDYQYLSTYIPGTNYFGTSGLVPLQLTNPLYGWETINKSEAALELGFLKNRFLFNSSIYRNRTSNQLVGYSLPLITGFPNVQANLPAIIENKGLELELNTINLESKNFKWNSSFNISFPKNKLISYPGIENSNYATKYVVGQPLNITFVYKSTGVDPTTGIYTFEDINKDGTINSSGDRYPVFNGQRYFGGLNNSFSYNSFSLDVFFQFVKQTGYNFAGVTTPGSLLVTGTNLPIIFLDRWRSPNDIVPYQKYSATNGTVDRAWSRFNLSDQQIVDASFIRLKNISFSWLVPTKWIDHIKLKQVRIYLQGQNLLTITNFKGMDPESQSYGSRPSLPPLRMITAGIQVSL